MRTPVSVPVIVRPFPRKSARRNDWSSSRKSSRESESLDSEAAFQAVRQAIATTFEVEVYSIVLAKAGVVPKTTSGKRRRAACRDLFLQDELDVHARWTAEIKNGHPHPLVSEHRGAVHTPTAKEIEDWLVQRIAARLSLPTSQIQVNKPFLEMGMGSLDAMEIAADLQTLAQPPSLSHGDLQLPQHLVAWRIGWPVPPGLRHPPVSNRRSRRRRATSIPTVC